MSYNHVHGIHPETTTTAPRRQEEKIPSTFTGSTTFGENTSGLYSRNFNRPSSRSQGHIYCSQNNSIIDVKVMSMTFDTMLHQHDPWDMKIAPNLSFMWFATYPTTPGKTNLKRRPCPTLYGKNLAIALGPFITYSHIPWASARCPQSGQHWRHECRIT